MKLVLLMIHVYINMLMFIAPPLESITQLIPSVILGLQCLAANSLRLVHGCVQGSEAESVNGPGQDSGLDTASRHEPSGTLPSRVEAPAEATEGLLCRKQEMESQGKKAANRYKHTAGEENKELSVQTISMLLYNYYPIL